MKTYLYKMVAITLISLNVLAHPQDSDLVGNIPKDSRLIFNSDINIIPNSSAFSLGYIDRNAVCRLEFAPSVYDRIIGSNSIFDLSAPYRIVDGGIRFESGSDNKLSLACARLTTIGELRGFLRNNGIELQLSEPIKF